MLLNRMEHTSNLLQFLLQLQSKIVDFRENNGYHGLFPRIQGTREDTSGDWKTFPDYVGGRESNSPLVRKLEEEINRVKKNWEWRREYMALLMHDQENIEKENQDMEIKHLIFDLDGTLWNTTKVSADAYNDALRKDGRCDLVITAQHIKNEFGKSLQAIADDLFPGFDRPVRDDLMHQCAVSNIRFLAETDDPMLYSDVRSTLDVLVQSSQLYIVSNCETGYIEMFLKKYDLESYFTDIECLGNNGNSKADNIRLLMERNQIPSAVYVGDTDGDYQSAVSAKIPFIFAAYGYGTVRQSCPVIHSFSELLTL